MELCVADAGVGGELSDHQDLYSCHPQGWQGQRSQLGEHSSIHAAVILCVLGFAFCGDLRLIDESVGKMTAKLAVVVVAELLEISLPG